MKRCKKCGRVQPLEHFTEPPRRRTATGAIARTATFEQYDAMLAEQGGGCAICGRRPSETISLHVDHDHETGRIRGLLCFRCNNSLGDLDDSQDLLWAALRYVQPSDDPDRPLVLARLAALKASFA